MKPAAEESQLQPPSSTSLEASNTALSQPGAEADHMPNCQICPATKAPASLEQRGSGESQQSPANISAQPQTPEAGKIEGLELSAATLVKATTGPCQDSGPVGELHQEPEAAADIPTKQSCTTAIEAKVESTLPEEQADFLDQAQAAQDAAHEAAHQPQARRASNSSQEPSRSDGSRGGNDGAPHVHAKWQSQYVRLKKQHQLPLTPSRLLHLPSYLAEELLNLKQCVNEGFMLQVEADGVMDAASWPATLSIYKNATGYNYYRIAGSRPLASKYQGWIIQGWAAVDPTTVCMVLSSKPATPTVIDFDSLKRPTGAIAKHGFRETKKLRTGTSINGQTQQEATSHKVAISQHVAAALPSTPLQTAVGMSSMMPTGLATAQQQAAGIAQLQAGLQICASLGMSVPAALAAAMQQLAQPTATPAISFGSGDAASLAHMNQQVMLLPNAGNPAAQPASLPLQSNHPAPQLGANMNTAALTNLLLNSRQAAHLNPAPAPQNAMYGMTDVGSGLMGAPQLTPTSNVQVFLTPSGQLAIQSAAPTAAPTGPSTSMATQLALCAMQGLPATGGQSQVMGQTMQQDTKQLDLSTFLAANGMGLGMAPGLMSGPSMPQMQMQALPPAHQQLLFLVQPQQLQQQQPDMMMVGQQQQQAQEWGVQAWGG